jgi:hypothetical protein
MEKRYNPGLGWGKAEAGLSDWASLGMDSDTTAVNAKTKTRVKSLIALVLAGAKNPFCALRQADVCWPTGFQVFLC